MNANDPEGLCEEETNTFIHTAVFTPSTRSVIALETESIRMEMDLTFLNTNMFCVMWNIYFLVLGNSGWFYLWPVLLSHDKAEEIQSYKCLHFIQHV